MRRLGQCRALLPVRETGGRAGDIAAHHAGPVAVEVVGNKKEGHWPGRFIALQPYGSDTVIENSVQVLQRCGAHRGQYSVQEFKLAVGRKTLANRARW